MKKLHLFLVTKDNPWKQDRSICGLVTSNCTTEKTKVTCKRCLRSLRRKKE